VEVQLFVPGSLEPRYVMEVVKVVRHPDYDAALLTVEWLPVEFASPFEVSAWQPVAGEWVMSGGYARAGLLVLHDGYVATWPAPRCCPASARLRSPRRGRSVACQAARWWMPRAGSSG